MLKHVVVDGSNIATEGRSAPSLHQLDEAVRAFLDEFDVESLSVVVDATFGHRIDKSERAEFDEAIAANELVTPPAGAVGRGDAFVLQIASRVAATVLSNDSFQEFHAEYEWLFEEDRLIGGKPVPGVGWVFVPRVPVRGPRSGRGRKDRRTGGGNGGATDSGDGGGTSRRGGGSAGKPRPRKKERRDTPKLGPPPVPSAATPPPAPMAEDRTRGRGTRGNPADVASSFERTHPVGSTVEATVEQFASHGAYVRVGDARCYVPLNAMGDPAPRSAKVVLTRGDDQPFIVERVDPSTGEIDLALAGFERTTGAPTASRSTLSKEPTPQSEETMAAAKKKSATKKKAPAKRKTTAKKKAPAKRKTTAKKKAPAKRKTTAKKKAPAKRKTTAKKKAPAKRKTTAKKKAPAKRKTTAKKKAPAKRKTTAKKKAPAKRKTTAKKKAPAKRKTTAKKK